MSCGQNTADNFHRAAGHVGKVLEGAKPADPPMGQPTGPKLVTNMKTTKALGLRVPRSLMPRADEVIR